MYFVVNGNADGVRDVREFGPPFTNPNMSIYIRKDFAAVLTCPSRSFGVKTAESRHQGRVDPIVEKLAI